jgi:hypothetical protein
MEEISERNRIFLSLMNIKAMKNNFVALERQ